MMLLGELRERSTRSGCSRTEGVELFRHLLDVRLVPRAQVEGLVAVNLVNPAPGHGRFPDRRRRAGYKKDARGVLTNTKDQIEAVRVPFQGRAYTSRRKKQPSRRFAKKESAESSPKGAAEACRSSARADPRTEIHRCLNGWKLATPFVTAG